MTLTDARREEAPPGLVRRAEPAVLGDADDGLESVPPREPLGLVGYTARAALSTLGLFLLLLSAFLLLVSPLEHRVDQTRSFDQFRNELANGTAPVGPLSKGRLLALGTPIALLQIPALGLKQVVGEGTTGATLMAGPGHLRTTVMPGQIGTSVVFGRAAAYGGPFRGIHQLRRGDRIVVTTQVGQTTFRVVDVRTAGRKLPVLAAGAGRLTLVTATGSPFIPAGVLYVDADTKSPLPVTAPPAIALPHSELALGTDTSTLWRLVFWLQALLLLAVAAAWAWRRWGRPQTWVVFVPVALLVGYYLSGQITVLLPNLM